MARDLVSIVIINFNSGQHIFKCLDKIKDQTYPNIEVLVIDNNSQDGSSQKVSKYCEDSQLIYHHSSTNLGSSKANNLGIRLSRGEYVLIQNADVFLQPDYVEKCVEAFKQDPRIGTVVGKFLSAGNPQIIDSAGVMLFSEGASAERGMGEADVGQYDRPEYVAGACCAAAMYSRKLLNDLKYEDEYFDEDFFAFFEDLDLSVTGLLLNWRTFYLPDAVCYHVRGGSTKKVSDFAAYLSRRNWQLFYAKTFEPSQSNKSISSIIYRAIFALIMRRKFGAKIFAEVKQMQVKMHKKRAFFAKRANYELLKPQFSGSFLVYRAKKALRSKLGVIANSATAKATI